jgi:hypothetical protein
LLEEVESDAEDEELEAVEEELEELKRRFVYSRLVTFLAEPEQ